MNAAQLNTTTPSSSSSRESPLAMANRASVRNAPRANISNPNSQAAFTRFRPSSLTPSSTTRSPLLNNAASTPRNAHATQTLNKPLAPSVLHPSIVAAAPVRKSTVPSERPVTILTSMHTTTTGSTTRRMPAEAVSRSSLSTCNASGRQQRGAPSPTVVNAMVSSIQRTPSSMHSMPANATRTLTANNAVTKPLESNSVAVSRSSTTRQPYHSNSKQPSIGLTIHATSLNQPQTRSPSQAINASGRPISSQTIRRVSCPPNSNGMASSSIQGVSSRTVTAMPTKPVQMVSKLTDPSDKDRNVNTAGVSVATSASGLSTFTHSASINTASTTRLTGLPSASNGGRRSSTVKSTQFYLVPSHNSMSAINHRNSIANSSGGSGPGKPAAQPRRTSQSHSRVQANIVGTQQASKINTSSSISSHFANPVPNASAGCMDGSRRRQDPGVHGVSSAVRLSAHVLEGNNPSPLTLSTSGLPATNPSRAQGNKSLEDNAVQWSSHIQTSVASRTGEITPTGERHLPLIGPPGTQGTNVAPKSTKVMANAGVTKSSFSRMKSTTTTKDQIAFVHDTPAFQGRSVADARKVPGVKGANICVDTGSDRGLPENSSRHIRGCSTSQTNVKSTKLYAHTKATSQFTPTKRQPSVSPETLAASVERSRTRPSPSVPKAFTSALSPASVTHDHSSQQGIRKSTAPPAVQSEPLPILPKVHQVENSRIPADMSLNDMEHVTVWNRVERRKIAGNAAPLGKNIERYLREHRECEVYTNQDAVERQGRRASGLQPSATLSSGGHVSVWNRVEKRKISGNAAPLGKNLEAYLQKNPNCEVYNFQDRPHEAGRRIQAHSNDNVNVTNQRQQGQLPSQDHRINANKLPQSGHIQTVEHVRSVRQYATEVHGQARGASSASVSQKSEPFFDLEKFISFENDEDLKHCTDFYDGTLPPLSGCLEIPN